ncbi:MAG: XdhC family protein [Clostridiales bacterium]|nr:XdhC family protein [Clostridiales bacterium]
MKMEQLFLALLEAARCGKDAVLCSIIASSGSAPRRSGAKMAVFTDGSTIGSIGGGAVEYESVQLAKRALAERAAFCRGFRLTENQTADIGMICGGQVVVYFQFFGGNEALALWKHIVSLFGQRKNTWLVTKITDGTARQMGVYAQDSGLCFANGIPEEEIRPLLCVRAMLGRGDPAYYAEPLTRAETVWVFGGGHVSQELVPLLARVGFSVAVFEDRAAFAAPALFPTVVRTICGDYSRIFEELTIAPEDYAVILTRGHQADFEVLRQVLQTQASYIGVIGSRHKIAITNRRLLDAGISESALSRIHTPIGLPIGAETPEEIAVSIAAELIAHRARRGGGGL